MEKKKIGSYKELEIWKLGRKISAAVYKMTASFPKAQAFVLSTQMQRAAISIPSNIAEGRSRGGIKEFIQFLYIAQGSKSELETQIIIAIDVGLTSETESSQVLNDLDVLGKMLNKMIISLKAKSNKL